MKICKVTLNKQYTIYADSSTKCKNTYPNGAKNVDVISYDEYPLIEGDNAGYCIGIVSDDFVFTVDMAEITKAEADIFIEERADIYLPNTERRDKYEANKKRILTDAGII